MSFPKETKLVHYLSDDRSFLEVAKSAFEEGIAATRADALYLYQITRDNHSLRLIVQTAADDRFKRPDEETLELSQAQKLTEYLTEQSGADSITGEGYSVSAPVIIRDKVAMYIVMYRQADRFTNAAVGELTLLALILQSIATDRNFQDSLEYSYRFLETAIDEIPVGFSVMTPNCDEILLMNQVAAESTAVQNVTRKAINLYLESSDMEYPELYEEDTGRWYDARFHETTWIDGGRALICTAFDVTEKMMNQQRIEYQANNDYLTGLFNRMRCERDLTIIIENAVRANERGAVLFLDLDNFKQVNDGLGHQYGDVLLQEIAAGIRTIPQIENHCYRMGGDEFVIVILPEYFAMITQIVDCISKMFNEPWKLMDVEYYCTMSMGLAIYPDHATNVQDAIQKADFAMYEAKKDGKNRYRWYTPDDPDKQKKDSLEKSIRTMVGDACKDFTLHYQPVFDCERRLIGAEALVRINSDQFGELLPAEFLPVAEYLGLMNRIGDHVLEVACATLATWRKSFRQDFLMFVNISPTQLLQTKSVERILDIIHRAGVEPENVVLDVSERIEFRDEEKALSTLEILHAHGVKIAMDDFGSGRQSITMMERLKASYIKFESDFLDQDKANMTLKEGIIAAVSAMASATGAQIGFVGVETQAQESFALSHGAKCLEGYFYGEPLPVEDFEARWR